MAQIDYYFSTISPYTYLAGTRMEEMAARHGADIAYKPFDIMAVFPRTGGTAPADRHPARLELRAQELRRQSRKHDLPMDLDPPTRAVNPAPSSYAFIAAMRAGGGGDLGKLVQAFTGAVWRDRRDIAQDDVIADCLEAAGFDRGLAGMAMLQGADEYGRNTEHAVLAGAFGAPFYIVDGTEKFWGQDKIEDLDLYLAGNL